MLVPLHKKSAAEATKQFSVNYSMFVTQILNGYHFLEPSDTEVLLGIGVGTCG